MQTARARNPWLINSPLDFLFFCTAWYPMAMLALVLTLPTVGISMLTFSIFAFHIFNRWPHFIVTWKITCGLQQNLAYYKERWGIFFSLGPAIILALFFVPLAMGHRLATSYLIMVYLATCWGIQHVGMQHFGLLALYRRRSGAPFDPLAFKLEKAVCYVLIVAACAYFLTIQKWVSKDFVPHIKQAITGIHTLLGVLVAVHARHLWKTRKTHALTTGFFVYYATALISMVRWPFFDALHPLAFFFVMSGQHNWAYVGLGYLMETNDQKKPVGLSSWTRFYLPMLALSFGIMFGVNWLFPFEKTLDATMTAAIGLFTVHYYLDAFVWKFSNKHNRDVIMPLLAPPEAALNAATEPHERSHDRAA